MQTPDRRIADVRRDGGVQAVQGSADCGNGMYRNPVLFADYSDPDVIRVGEDYWLTASSFNHVPGLPVLHSCDLVNWTLVNYALPRLVPSDYFAQPRHGGGVWAPALRFHQGRFWLFYPDPDFGLYAVTANHPAGRWSEPVCVKPGHGLIDPCPFWDDDGTGYLVHAWAKSRSGIKNRLTLHRLSADGLGVVDDGEIIVDGDQMAGWHTIEGPKLYKRNGYYYIFAPAGGVRDGYQAVFRSHRLRGPFESRIVLAQGRTTVNGPHQGAWVDTPAGGHWFFHFQELPAFGRVVHLQPVTWHDDWPEIGAHSRSGPGEPVARFARPVMSLSNDSCPRPASATAFDVPALDWQWQANPRRDWISAEIGRWRLRCVELPVGANLRQAGHLLLRKFIGPEFVATVALHLVARCESDRTGLIVFGDDYAWIGLRREQGSVKLVFCVCLAAHQQGAERTVEVVEDATNNVEVRVSVDAAARCTFAYRVSGGEFRTIGSPFQATSGSWVGAKVGVFAATDSQAMPVGQGHAIICRFTLENSAAADHGRRRTIYIM